MNEITLKEFSEIFKYVIENNKKLVDAGKNPVCISAEGPCGVGKTTAVQELSESLGATFVKINLAELEEISDLVGFPIKEYEIKNDYGSDWVPADLLPTYSCREDIMFTGVTRMGYAPPAWLPRDENPNGCILLIDDYTRANQLFMQACMELINTGKYVSWNLPKYTSIVLTTNPDNTSYSVSSLDPAQKSRFCNFSIKFSINDFAEWAERYNLDTRGINFALYYNYELFDPNNPNHIETINPRSFTTFMNIISGIENWDKPENLALILNISKGCFHDPDNVVGGLFTSFIANKLDQLVSPEDMLTQSWEKLSPRIKECVYDSNGAYHPEIASILHTRLLNHTLVYMSKTGAKAQPVIDRLTELADQSNEKDKFFSEDLMFSCIKTLVAKTQGRLNKMLFNPNIRKRIL